MVIVNFRSGLGFLSIACPINSPGRCSCRPPSRPRAPGGRRAPSRGSGSPTRRPPVEPRGAPRTRSTRTPDEASFFSVCLFFVAWLTLTLGNTSHQSFSLNRCREINYIELNSLIRRRLHTLYSGFDIASRHMHWIVFAAVCARRAALRTRSRSSMIV